MRNNSTLTNQISDEIGEKLTTVKRIRNHHHKEIITCKYTDYVVNWKYLITIYFNDSNDEVKEFIIQDYEKIREEQKRFGQYVAKLEKNCNIPYNIAQLVDHIENEDEAIIILEYIKKCKVKVKENRELYYKLYSSEANKTIKEILCENVYNKLSTPSSSQIFSLIHFLSS